MSKSDPDPEDAIAITVAIKNRSGKIGNRISSRNQIPICPVKPICDLHLQFGSRWKKRFSGLQVMTERVIGSRFLSEIRSAIFIVKTIRDFHLVIGAR